MAAPNTVFWIEDLIKVYERKMPDTKNENGAFEEYRMFVGEMYAYLIGLRSSLRIHQERLDRQKECPVCGKERMSGDGVEISNSDHGKSINIHIEQPH